MKKFKKNGKIWLMTFEEKRLPAGQEGRPRDSRTRYASSGAFIMYYPQGRPAVVFEFIFSMREV